MFLPDNPQPFISEPLKMSTRLSCLNPSITEKRSLGPYAPSYIISRDTIASLISFLDPESCQTLCQPIPKNGESSSLVGMLRCLRNTIRDAFCGYFSGIGFFPGDGGFVFDPEYRGIIMQNYSSKAVRSGTDLQSTKYCLEQS